MPRLGTDDLVRIRDSLFFEGATRTNKLTRFWLLLTLSAVIASAGVVSDSTATVIGAMIVAPLMTPILGLSFSLRLRDGVNIRRSLLLVVAGAATVIAIGMIFGWTIRWDVVSSSNAQVAARVSPHLIDLVAALATGAVGAVALARSDISDTLPGVAIAISLVPPLAVVGLTLAARSYSDARGALTLFVTNVAAILAMGSVVFALYRVPRSGDAASTSRWQRWRSSVAVVGLLVIIAIPLTRATVRISNSSLEIQEVSSVARPWANAAKSAVVSVVDSAGTVIVSVVGPDPGPSTTELHDALVRQGYGEIPVKVGFVTAVVTPVQ